MIKSSPIRLSDVVKESNLIVEVQCVEPFTEKVPVKNTDSAPPFVKRGYVFRIKNILKNDTGLKSLPETIQVPDESWRRSMSEHVEKHANGPSRSYHVREHETDVKSMKEARILFLNHFQGMFELTAKDSFESNEAREKIEMLLASKR